MNRDLRIDTLRGVLLIIITMNHLGSVLVKITYQPLGFVTAMEGFIFISGLVAGIVYSKAAHKEGEFFLWRKTLHRAWTIYATHLFVVVLLTLIAVLFQSYLADNLLWSFLLKYSPLYVIIRYASLVYNTPFLQILPIYCVLLLLVAPAVQLFMRGYWVVVILVSVSLWLLVQYGFVFRPFAEYIPYAGSYAWLAWQVLFISGLSAGYLRVTYPDKPVISCHVGLFLLCLVLAAPLFLTWHLPRFTDKATLLPYIPSILVQFEVGINQIIPLKELTAKGSLAWLRLLNFIVIAYLVACLASRYKKLFTWHPIAFLGQHSLPVFAFHILQVFALHASGIQIKNLGLINNLLITAMAIASLYAVAWLDQWYRQRHLA